MTSDIIASIRKELQASVDSVTRNNTARYFKEPITLYGVKTAVVNRIAAHHYSSVKGLSLHHFFNLCEELLKSDYCEEAFIVFNWAQRMEKNFDRNHFSILERWLHDYVNNWAKCDTLCNHPAGSMVSRYPELVDNLKRWTASANRWVRRGSAVTLILPARRGLFLDDIFNIADRLLADTDDLVQKGNGWMLKEASRLHQREVFDYIMKNKAVMPRTSLRYAIEKMPPDLRRSAMSRE